MDMLRRERWRLLVNVVRGVEPLMALLGIVWLLLVVLEFTRGLGTLATTLSRAIWMLFVADFLARLFIAPDKLLYLRRQWLVALSLALPALRFARFIRVLRVARVARSIRGLRLLRTLTSVNRAISSLRATMRRRGFGYVMAMTVAVTVGGAAGMYALEDGVPDAAGIHDFATALWWTAMIMTTMGSAYWPQTAEGRVLCVFLALYAFAVFGYVTATLATFFVSRDAERDDAPLAGDAAVAALRRDVRALRQAVEDAAGVPRGPDSGTPMGERH
jgi:voltage-gated potassium channel